MDRFLVDRFRLGARAVAARLQAVALLDRRSLPEVLSGLTPVPDGADSISAKRPCRGSRVVPRDVVEAVIAASEQVIERLRVVPDTCLYRALARYAVLRRAGHPARFVMGLDPRASDISGHAWVEIDGEPVGETLDPGLTVTFQYPASAS
ncbi:MAG: lasso peptide biosynthesis B2 protein [Minicystis sp.]